VGNTNPGGYTVTANSRTGNTFTIAKTAKGTTRGCSSRGTTEGGCDDGHW
jgi:hypothetical protein